MSNNANNNLVTGAAGIELVKICEGFKATAYLCPAKIPTIGYGHIGADVTAADVGKKTITEAEADALLRKDLKTAENGVKKCVTVALNQGQFDALVSFVYNLGAGNLQSSTLLKKLNAGDTAGAAEEFHKWRKAGGKVLEGLVKRRAAESAIFLGNLNWKDYLTGKAQPA